MLLGLSTRHGGIITAEEACGRDCMCHGKQKSNWGRDQAQPYRAHPQWLTSSIKTLLSKVARAPKIAPAVGDQTFNRHTSGSQFIFRAQQLCGTPTAGPSMSHTYPGFKDNLSGWYGVLQRECKLPQESSEESVETIWRHDKGEGRQGGGETRGRRDKGRRD